MSCFGLVNLIKYQELSTNVSIVSVSRWAGFPQAGQLTFRQSLAISRGFPGVLKDTFSGRIKCRGVNDIKKLTVYEICKDKVKVDGVFRSSCHYNNDDVFDKIYIGRMEANLNNGEKQQFIYFQIY